MGRAGALAGLEECRDELVMRFLTMMQGEIYKRIRGRIFVAKRDQRDLISVAQRNFRKYLKYRDWGWMNVINQTRKLIGKPDVNEELRLLEEKANAVYGEYIQAKEEKERLLEENEKIKEEKKAILKQIEQEQGSLSVYHEKQANMKAETAELEGKLGDAQGRLKDAEERRVEATEAKKSLELETVSIKKDIGAVYIEKVRVYLGHLTR